MFDWTLIFIILFFIGLILATERLGYISLGFVDSIFGGQRHGYISLSNSSLLGIHVY